MSPISILGDQEAVRSSREKQFQRKLSSIALLSRSSYAYYLFVTLLLIHITHWMKKYTRTAKAGGLNGLRSAKKKKRREEFTGIEEGFN